MSIANMNTADRLAEKLKTGPMSDFFTEDDLLELSKQAIKKAFFEERPGEGYNSAKKVPLVVEYAQTALKEQVSEWVKEKFSEIITDEDFQKETGRIMLASLGGVLIDSMRENWQRQFFQDLHQNSALLSDLIKRHS